MGRRHENLGRSTAAADVPRLRAGDRLTRVEFERRYEAMPEVKKAELIEGVVYMPSPVSQADHGGPHFQLVGWLALYAAATPGVEGGDNATIRLDGENEPQPDALLRIRPELGGQTRDGDGYIEGAPELVAEVTASTASYDLHDKLRAYQRNGVCEYVAWRVWDRQVDWFVLCGDRYDRLPLSSAGRYESRAFPGLWLDPAALVEGDLATVLAAAQQGIATAEHGAFVEQLRGRAS